VASARTGIWSAVGAFVLGTVGALAGREVAKAHPGVRYAVRRRSGHVTDVMVAGGAAGAVVGAFIGGALAGDTPALPPK